MTKIELLSGGACEEVTGSKHYLKLNNFKVMIDCGLWQGNKKTEKKNKKVNIGVRIVGIFMLLLMLASPIIAILSYVVK